MWLLAVSGEAPAAPGDSLLIAIFTFLGVVVTTIGVIVVQAIKSRAERTAPAPPGPSDTAVLIQLATAQGALVERADDNDERDHVQDIELRDQRMTLDDHHKRMTRIERWVGIHDPDWQD